MLDNIQVLPCYVVQGDNFKMHKSLAFYGIYGVLQAPIKKRKGNQRYLIWNYD